MKRATKSLKPVCVALPKPLLRWIDAEAKTNGQSRGAYIGFILAVYRQNGVNRDLVRRVAALEVKIKSYALTKISI